MACVTVARKYFIIVIVIDLNYQESPCNFTVLRVKNKSSCSKHAVLKDCFASLKTLKTFFMISVLRMLYNYSHTEAGH